MVIPVVLTAGLNPACARADDASRISRLESELQQLRIRLDAQDRRIQRLEEQLKARGGAQAPGTITGRREIRPATEATGPLPWHSPAPWAQIRKGMTEAEVTEILGEPTSVESAGSLKTLFYRGTAAGRGAVSGHVNLRDGRVLAVNPPALGD